MSSISPQQTMPICFDLHLHTDFSPCANMQPEDVVQTAFDRGLNAIVITDHNQFGGALRARNYWLERKDYFKGFQVHIGVEMRTEFGEINALFLDDTSVNALRKIQKSGRIAFPFTDVVSVVRELKAAGHPIMIGLNHCFARSIFSTRGGFDLNAASRSSAFSSMESLLQFFDYVELNGNNLSAEEGVLAVELAQKYNRPVVCNSDGHFRGQIGNNFTHGRYPTPRECILAAQLGEADAIQIPHAKQLSYWKNYFYRFHSRFLKLLAKLG